MTDNRGFIKAVAKKLFNLNLSSKRSVLTEKQLKAKESEIGAKIFGPIKPGERRAFFNDNEKSWFFHQEIMEKGNISSSMTLHYEVQPSGILRISSDRNVKNEFINGQELKNFIQATEMYHERVMSQLYKR